MGKFDILDDKDTQKVINESALTENTPAPVVTKKETKDFSVKGFPKDLHDAIVANKSETGNVNAFVRRACMKLAKEEGLL